MKINIKKTKEKYGSVPCYTYDEIENFCCEQMKEAIGEDVIKFGEYESMLNTSKSLNIFKCHVYPEGAFWDEYEINFCPFCGEKIEYVE